MELHLEHHQLYMSKRKRIAEDSEPQQNPESKQRCDSFSLTCPDPPRLLCLPLLTENLQKLERTKHTRYTKMPNNSGSRSGRSSPSKASSVKSGSQGSFKLGCFGIHVDTGVEKPADLAAFLETRVRRTAQDMMPTPSSKKIANKSRAAVLLNEVDGRNMLRHLLLGTPAVEADDPEDGIQNIALSGNSNLSTVFLPVPVDNAAQDIYKSLEQPQPDEMLGYIRYGVANTHRPILECPFTEEDERLFHTFRTCESLSFPFLTCQWKSQKNGGNLTIAKQQGSRDGAVIVSSMYQLYRSAWPDQEPSVVDTVHFSLTCDMETITAWVHWRQIDAMGKITYEMERIAQGFLNDESMVWPVRCAVRNVTNWALDERLQRIREALLILKSRPIVQPWSMVSSVPTAQSLSITLSPMISTPASSIPSTQSQGDPARKRQRQDGSD